MNGAIAQTVTISGTYFGATQGTSAVKFFNNVTATVAPNGWSDNSVTVTVPSGATTGPVAVTTAGGTSNSLTFTVLNAGSVAGLVTRATGGAAVSGALVEALQSGVVRATTTSAGNGAYSLTNLPAGAYEVRTSASGLATELATGVVVSGGGTTTLNVALVVPGSIVGQVTQPDGLTPIPGAAVSATQGSATAGSTTADANGTYALNGVRPGTYDVHASAIGYTPATSSGAVVTEGNATTVNATLSPLNSSEIRYAYDEASRLIGATIIDGSGNSAGSATYKYDEVGNLTSITRIPAATTSIAEFTPNAGLVGSTVTIFGTGFSANPIDNQVAINGQSATVTSATTTQLSVTVPSVTSGPITVSTPSGSASTDPVNFTVLTTGGPPAISGFTPVIGVAGTAVTINGANFDTTLANDRVAFNIQYAPASSATVSSVSVNVVAAATSGKITVSTPAGRAVSADDFFIPPPPYTVADVSATARFGFTQTALMTIAQNKIGLAVFDATAGQRVSVAMTDCTFAGVMTLYDPYGVVMVQSAPVDSYGGIFGPLIVPFTGTYTVFISNGTSTGTVRAGLYVVPADVTGSITIGGSATLQIDVAGQNGTLTFSGNQNQRISLLMSQVSINLSTVSILKPDGTQLAASNGIGTSGAFIDTTTLPVTGTYTILLDPIRAGTGSMRFDLYDVSADFSGTITIGGNAVTVPISVAGQNGRLTFTGTQNQRISLTVTNVVTIGNATITILKPDGTTQASGTAGLGGGFIDTTTLPVTGTYTVVVDPLGANTGSLDVRLYAVTDFTASITPTTAGTNITVPLTTPGQNGLVTFSGTSGQRISMIVGAGPLGTVTLKKPDGTTLASQSITVLALFMDAQTLPTTGTYTIFVDPLNAGTGNVPLTVYNVPADAIASTTVNGTATPITIGTPGQNGKVTFSGSNNQHVTVHVTVNGIGNIAVQLQKSDGTVLASGSGSGVFDLTQVTLPANGTYTVFINPSLAGTGTVSIRVTSP